MSLRIMVVEQDPEILDMVCSIARSLGYDITSSMESLEAARCLESAIQDGILIDAYLSGLDGFELTKRVKASKPNRDTPIVIILDSNDLEGARRAFKAGAICYISKPISRDLVYNVLKAMRGPFALMRRRSARLPFHAQVVCTQPDFGGRGFSCGSLNISEGGMLLERSGGQEVGQELWLEFLLPGDKKAHRLLAKVLRRDPEDRVAVQFVGVKERTREAIQNYLVGYLEE